MKNIFFRQYLLEYLVPNVCRDHDEQTEVASLEGVQEEQGDYVAAVDVCGEVHLTA